MAVPVAVRAQRWAGWVVPALTAAGALALAIAGAIVTNRQEGIGWLNTFVESLSGQSGTLLSDLPLASLSFAFGAGMVSAVNPCGFSMLPAYLGLYLGARDTSSARPSMLRRLAQAWLVGGAVTAGFVALFSVVGAVLGAGTQALADAFPWVGLAVGVLLVLAGAWLLSGAKFYTTIMARAASGIGNPGQVSPRGYFLFGVSYGTASLSCTLPVFLAVVGATLAVSGLLEAIGQFILYALGMGLVILALTIALALFKGALVGTLQKALPYVQPLSALFMVLAGSYIVFYWLTIGGLLDRIS